METSMTLGQLCPDWMGCITVAQYAMQWVTTYHGDDSVSARDYRSVVNNVIIPNLGAYTMDVVVESMLQDLLNHMAIMYSQSWVHKTKLTICQLFQKAVKNKIITDNPADDLKMPKCKKGTRRPFTDQELSLLLEAIKGHRGEIFVLLMLYCGLRPQEAATLQWRHVDLNKRLIHVEQARKRATGKIGDPKSEAGYRYVPIPQPLYEVLRRKIGFPSAYVSSWDGNYIDQKQQDRMWRNIRRRMDIAAGAKVYRNQIVESVLADDLVLYCLRHTYCSNLQHAGIPINIAKTLMGHEDINVTASIYTHSNELDAEAAIAAIDCYYQEHSPTARNASNATIIYLENYRRRPTYQ